MTFGLLFFALFGLLAPWAERRAGAADRSATPEGSASRFVQWTSGDSGAATSETTYLNSVPSGNVLLVFSHWDNQALTASVADSSGNKYLPVGGPLNAGTAARFEVWYARKIRGGDPLAVTVRYSGRTTSFSLVDVAEYDGLDNSAPLDVFASATGTGSLQDSGPSPHTTASNERVVGFFGYPGYALPYTAGAGFSFRAYDASSMLEDRAVTATGSYHATATSNRPDAWAAFVICFRNAPRP